MRRKTTLPNSTSCLDSESYRNLPNKVRPIPRDILDVITFTQAHDAIIEKKGDPQDYHVTATEAASIHGFVVDFSDYLPNEVRPIFPTCS